MKVKWPTVRRAVLKLATPVLKTVGLVHMPPHYRSIKSSDTTDIIRYGLPGDVLLSRRDLEITNPIIPGYWKHAAMYDGKGRVIEAIGKGVIETSLEEFCTTKDSVVLLRAGFVTNREAELALEHARELRGRPYDFLVEYGYKTPNLAFYCSEVIWWSYDQVFQRSGKPSPFTPRQTMGIATITPQDFWEAKAKWFCKSAIYGKIPK